MQITITDVQQKLCDEMHEFAHRRIQFALSRFAPRIRAVTLVLNDVQSGGVPAGMVDEACRIEVELLRCSRVTLTARAGSLQAAVARAVERAARAVARTIETNVDPERSRPFAT